MSQRFIWLSDLHLNFVNPKKFADFCDAVSAQQPDAIFIGGDIGESHSLAEFLILMDDAWQIPIYFVLGNHDFYRSSIQVVRRQIQQLCRVRPRLIYLTQRGVISVSEKTAMIGHDGWSDARAGNYDQSDILLNDYALIEELANLTKKERRSKLQELGDEAAGRIESVLTNALSEHQTVYLLTHVPPLREACWHLGKISDDDWSPHFVCQAMGETILHIMKDYPNHQLTVLCGHTHSSGEANPLPNVKIITGCAEYGKPAIQEVFNLE